MAEILNLRAARKRRDRAEKEREAERNRTLHGRTKAEKTAEAAERARSLALLDGHRLDGATPDDADSDRTP